VISLLSWLGFVLVIILCWTFWRTRYPGHLPDSKAGTLTRWRFGDDLVCRVVARRCPFQVPSRKRSVFRMDLCNCNLESSRSVFLSFLAFSFITRKHHSEGRTLWQFSLPRAFQPFFFTGLDAIPRYPEDFNEKESELTRCWSVAVMKATSRSAVNGHKR